MDTGPSRRLLFYVWQRCRCEEEGDVEEILRERQVDQVSQAEECEKVRDPPPGALNGQESAPGDERQVDLLTPPVTAGLLGYYLKGILIDRSVGEPTDLVCSELGDIELSSLGCICKSVFEDASNGTSEKGCQLSWRR